MSSLFKTLLIVHVKSCSFLNESRQANSEILMGDQIAKYQAIRSEEKQDEETCPTNESTLLNTATLLPALSFSILCFNCPFILKSEIRIHHLLTC